MQLYFSDKGDIVATGHYCVLHFSSKAETKYKTHLGKVLQFKNTIVFFQDIYFWK
jgi:hypothetical protein